MFFMSLDKVLHHKIIFQIFKENSYNEYLICGFNVYFFNCLFKIFLVTIYKFIIFKSNSLSLILLTMLFYFHFGLLKYFTSFTGVIIFYPACFVENPVHVILIVTMHFSQYLFDPQSGKKRLDNLDEFSAKKFVQNF